MQAVWLSDGQVELRDVPSPEPGPGEAIVAVRRAGICGTDVELIRGYADFCGVLGHEFVGDVVSCPTDESWIGRRVVAEINVGCDACAWCRAGVRAHCEQREVIGIRGRPGAFATHLAVPVGNLHAVPEGVEDVAAVFAEPLAAAYEILEQVDLAEESSVAIVGDGKLGLLITMALREAGVAPTVFGKYVGKGELAESLGATSRPSRDRSDRFDVVIEATGHPSGLADALARVRPRGTLLIKSTYREAPSIDLGRVVVDEIRILGSRCGPFDRALRALAAGRVDPRVLVEAVYPLSRAPEALEHAAERGALKVLLDPNA